MAHPKIVLDVQHIHKPVIDHGACFNGRTEVWESLAYARIAKTMLEEEGFEVYMTDQTQGILVGSYVLRHKWANENRIDLYFACHVNAGGGNYALVETVEGAYIRTELCAEFCAKEFGKAVGVDHRLFKLSKSMRGYSCISNLSASALLLEPYFIDNPAHRHEPEKIAQAIFDTAVFFEDSK